MAGLVLSLAPEEKVLIGGVVVQNGPKRARLRISDPSAGVLRLSEALHPDQATTPLTRAYYTAQTILSGDATEAEAAPILDRLMDDAVHGFSGFPFAGEIERARDAAREGRHCRAMRLLRPLLPTEAAILSRIGTPRMSNNEHVNHASTIGCIT